MDTGFTVNDMIVHDEHDLNFLHNMYMKDVYASDTIFCYFTADSDKPLEFKPTARDIIEAAQSILRTYQGPFFIQCQACDMDGWTPSGSYGNIEVNGEKRFVHSGAINIWRRDVGSLSIEYHIPTSKRVYDEEELFKKIRPVNKFRNRRLALVPYDKVDVALYDNEIVRIDTHDSEFYKKIGKFDYIGDKLKYYERKIVAVYLPVNLDKVQTLDDETYDETFNPVARHVIEATQDILRTNHGPFFIKCEPFHLEGGKCNTSNPSREKRNQNGTFHVPLSLVNIKGTNYYMESFMVEIFMENKRFF